MDKVTQVGLDGDVMYPGFQLAIEMFVVNRVHFEHYGITGKEEGEAVGGDGAVNVKLVFVL